MRTAGSGSESATRILKAIRAAQKTPDLTGADDHGGTIEDTVSKKISPSSAKPRGGLIMELNEKTYYTQQTSKPTRTTKNSVDTQEIRSMFYADGRTKTPTGDVKIIQQFLCSQLNTLRSKDIIVG